jgi:hypothetical protein
MIYLCSLLTFLGDVRREFTQRLSHVVHGTLDSYNRDAFEKANVEDVAWLHIPRA